MLARKWILSAAACATVALGVTQLAWSTKTQGDQSSSGGVSTDDSTFGPQAVYHKFTVPHSQSWPWGGGETQTVIKVVNNGSNPIDCVIDWRNFSGGNVGTSGTTIPVQESRFFSTANVGEPIPPWATGASTHYERDSTSSHYGHALVLIGPGTGYAKNVQVTAFLLNRIGDGYAGSGTGNASSVTTLQVMRADDPDGDGVIDTRYKGD